MRKHLFIIILCLAGAINACAETVTITYNYIWNGYIVRSESFECEVGDPFPNATVLPDYIEAMTPDDVVECEASYYIGLNLSPSFPFELAYSFKNAHWYFLTMGGKYLVYDPKSKTIKLQDELPQDFETLLYAAWSVTGDPFDSFQIINKGVGEDAYPVMPIAGDDFEAGGFWDVRKYPVDSSCFLLAEHDTDDYLTISDKRVLKAEDASEYVKYDPAAATYLPTEIVPASGSTLTELSTIKMTYKTWPGMIDAENEIYLYDAENKKVCSLFIDYDDDDDYVIWVAFGIGAYDDFYTQEITTEGKYHFYIPSGIIWEGQNFDMWSDDYGISAGAIFNPRMTFEYTVSSEDPNSITDVTAKNAGDDAMYNIAGQRISKANGLFIKDGKKYISK